MNLPGRGRWYRGNLHMHSLWSDGMQLPEPAAATFKEAGYHFIAFTEHDQFQTGERWLPLNRYPGTTLAESGFVERYEQAWGPVEWREGPDGRVLRLRALAEYRHELEEPGRFLILGGEEVSVSSAAGNHWLNVYGTDEAVPPLSTELPPEAAFDRLTELVERRWGEAALVSLNHPNYLWNASPEAVAATRRLRCLELHTALNCCWSYGDGTHPGAEAIWDRLLATRLAANPADVVVALASDDCHAYYPDCTVPAHENGSSMPLRAWVEVAAEELSQAAIIGALRGGRFICSTGVGIERIEADGSGVRLTIRPDPGQSCRTEWIGTRRGGRPGELLGEGESYRWRGDELYVRGVVVSDRLHPNPTVPGDTMKAWTQPLTPG